MVNYHEKIVKELSSILPTYYEFALSKDVKIPCLSYREKDNYQGPRAGEFGYSKVSYYIKVWAPTIAEIQQYSAQVNDKLRPLGWKCTSANEIWDAENMIFEKIFVYEGSFIEE